MEEVVVRLFLYTALEFAEQRRNESTSGVHYILKISVGRIPEHKVISSRKLVVLITMS